VRTEKSKPVSYTAEPIGGIPDSYRDIGFTARTAGPLIPGSLITVFAIKGNRRAVVAPKRIDIAQIKRKIPVQDMRPTYPDDVIAPATGAGGRAWLNGFHHANFVDRRDWQCYNFEGKLERGLLR